MEIKEILLKYQAKPITNQQLKKISFQMENCLCKITTKNNSLATGFLAKIPTTVLITNNHVLGEEEIKIGKKIKISFNDNKIIKEILIDKNRTTLTIKKLNEEEIDITIIEIKPDDHLETQNFLEIDNNLINQDIKNYLNKDIYIIQYPKGSESAFSTGIIKNLSMKIKSYDIDHNCGTDEGSSGSPIILYNHKLIGVHRGYIKKYCNDYNKGTLLKYPIELYNNKIQNEKNILMKSKFFENLKNNFKKGKKDNSADKLNKNNFSVSSAYALTSDKSSNHEKNKNYKIQILKRKLSVNKDFYLYDTTEKERNSSNLDNKHSRLIKNHSKYSISNEKDYYNKNILTNFSLQKINSNTSVTRFSIIDNNKEKNRALSNLKSDSKRNILLTEGKNNLKNIYHKPKIKKFITLDNNKIYMMEKNYVINFEELFNLGNMFSELIISFEKSQSFEDKSLYWLNLYFNSNLNKNLDQYVSNIENLKIIKRGISSIIISILVCYILSEEENHRGSICTLKNSNYYYLSLFNLLECSNIIFILIVKFLLKKNISEINYNLVLMLKNLIKKYIPNIITFSQIIREIKIKSSMLKNDLYDLLNHKKNKLCQKVFNTVESLTLDDVLSIYKNK